MREIFLYAVAALSLFALLGGIYQAMHNQNWAAGVLGGLFLVGALIVFIPQLEFIKAFSVEAKLRQTVSEAVATLDRLKAARRGQREVYVYDRRLGQPDGIS